jgi:predicted HAD superfamily Cof-like phosphohydrolase
MPKTNYQQLLDFHIGVNGSVPDTPHLPKSDSIKLWQKLIQEEYAEVMEAFAGLSDESFDIIPLMHELADLLYVVYGTFAIFGVDGDAVFGEVHRANMRKLDGPRRADGKLLKPPGWQPADVRGVIEQQKEATTKNGA